MPAVPRPAWLRILAWVLLLACGAASALESAGPRFRADGPQAEAFGRDDGYPRCAGFAYVREQRCRIGALSRFDELFPARTASARSPSPAYGYQVWLLLEPGRAFALRGLRGQFVLVDPGRCLVLVQTAARAELAAMRS